MLVSVIVRLSNRCTDCLRKPFQKTQGDSHRAYYKGAVMGEPVEPSCGMAKFYPANSWQNVRAYGYLWVFSILFLP